MNENHKDLEPTGMENLAKAVVTVLSELPGGGILAGVANEIIAKRQSRRLNSFLYKLIEKYEEVSEKINRDFVSKEEYQDLTEDILSKAAETKQKEKLEALKAIFLNTILSDKPDYNEAIEITALIDRWQPRHLILLKILSNPIEADEQMGRIVGNGSRLTTSISDILKKLLPKWDENEIERTWHDLYNTGINNNDITRTTLTDRGIHHLENRLTEYGTKVAKYLKEPV